MEKKISYSTVRDTWISLDHTIEKSIHFFKRLSIAVVTRSGIPRTLDLIVAYSVNELLYEINND